MAKKLVDFLKTQIQKAGGNPEDETLKNAIAGLSADLELPDEVVTAIDNGLLSIASAKNNHPEIKNHYFAQAYKGIDSEMDRLLEEEKLPDEVIAEIKKEGSSTKRAALIARKIKETESKKGAAGDKDKEKYTQQIAELNNQLAAVKDNENKIKATHQQELANIKMGWAKKNQLSAYKTIHDDLDPDTKQIILDAIITKNLNAKGWKLGVDDNGNLTLTTKEGDSVYGDNHVVLTPKAFLDKVMADEKILKVSDANNGNGGNNNNNNGQHQRQQHSLNNGHNQNGNNNGTKKGTGAMTQNLVAEALQSLDKASKSEMF